MKRFLLLIIVGFIILNCIAQEDNDKFLIGASITYSHDCLNNNSLLNNYYPYDKNLSNTFDVYGEFGYFLSPKTILGIEIEYLLNTSKQEQKIEGLPNSGIRDITSSGISINPKYKFIKRFSDKIWFYTDFKAVFQYLNHENNITQINAFNNEYEFLSMNGTELKYGFAVDPGIIFKVSKSLGLKLDYSLLNVYHSTIKKTNDSDIDFDNLSAWDYGLNMKLSGFNLGIVFTF